MTASRLSNTATRTASEGFYSQLFTGFCPSPTPLGYHADRASTGSWRRLSESFRKSSTVTIVYIDHARLSQKNDDNGGT